MVCTFIHTHERLRAITQDGTDVSCVRSLKEGMSYLKEIPGFFVCVITAYSELHYFCLEMTCSRTFPHLSPSEATI